MCEVGAQERWGFGRTRRELLRDAAVLGAGLMAPWLWGGPARAQGAGSGPERLPIGRQAGRKYPDVVRIGYQPSLCQVSSALVPYQTVERNLGVNVEWKLFPSGPPEVQAMASGQLDVAYIGVPPVFVGVDKGVPIKVVAAVCQEDPRLMGPAHFKDLREAGSLEAVAHQFRGKTVATLARGSVEDAIARAFFDRAGMVEGKDYTILNYTGGRAGLDQMIQKGEVVGTVEVGWLLTPWVKSGRMKVLVEARDLWPDSPCCCLAVTEKLLEEYPDFVEDYLRVNVAGAHFILAYPQEFAETASRFIKYPEPLAYEALVMSPHQDALITPEYVAASMRFIGVLQKAGFIRRELKESDVFYLDLIRKVHPEPYHMGLGSIRPSAELHRTVTGAA